MPARIEVPFVVGFGPTIPDGFTQPPIIVVAALRPLRHGASKSAAEGLPRIEAGDTAFSFLPREAGRGGPPPPKDGVVEGAQGGDPNGAA